MRTRTLAPLVAALLLSMGCGSPRGAIRELTEQRADMSREHALWTARLPVWRRAREEMKAWHATHPVSSKDEEALDRLRRHDESIAGLEEDTDRFQHDLSAIDAEMRRSSRRSERERLAAQAGLWAGHMKLKLAFEGLEAAQRELLHDHAGLIADSANVRE